MGVHTFYNPDLVGQLAACGITARRRSLPISTTAGWVQEGRRAAQRARQAVTPTIAVRGHVTITGPRELPARPVATIPASTSTEPQTALELVEECARLRRDNQRLLAEVDRLRLEVSLLSGGPKRSEEDRDLDAAATRFSLLELD